MTTTAPPRPGLRSRLLDRLLDPSGLALGRTAVGVWMLASPTALPRAAGVDRASAERVTWVVHMLGAREVALGLGAWTARRRARRTGDVRAERLWLAAGLLCDAVDAVAASSATASGRAGRAPGAVGVAVATTAVGIQARALARR